jgi:uncharacterized protein
LCAKVLAATLGTGWSGCSSVGIVKFMVLAWDVPGDSGLALRDRLREDHTDTITARFREGSVLLGAGIYDEASEVRGSVVIMDCESRASVDSYLQSEPFLTGGLWERVEVHELKLPDMYLEHLRQSPA